MSYPDADGLVVYARKGLPPESVASAALHVALGMFDGVHLGHIAVLNRAIKAARTENEFSAVFTFDPHPSRVLRMDNATQLIMPLERRIRRMHEEGIDYVLVKNFDREYASIEAEQFVPALLRAFPGLKSLHVGENFRFGAGRSGTVDTLGVSAEAAGLLLEIVEREHLDQDPVSSSRIRRDLAEGCMDSVNLMLGRSYVAEGIVVPGKGIGRKLDFPTLNLCWSPEARPKFGVYRVILQTGMDNRGIPGIANYGLRPTVNDSTDPLLEVHLLAGDVIPGQGDLVRVAFLEFVREERTFSSVDALKGQITEDVLAAKKAFATDKSLSAGL
jgi:riboflavin kinase/FMN adenylyltransferase